MSRLPEDAMRSWIADVLHCTDSLSVRLEPLAARGSDRAYWRAHAGGAGAVIVMHYDIVRPENAFWEPIGRFLASIGIPVPKVIACDSVRRLILIEDLGDRNLESLKSESRPEIHRMYMEILKVAHRLHTYPLEKFRRNAVPTMEGFSAELYRWEQNYFLENFVRDICGIDPAGLLRGPLGSELQVLSTELLAGPECLVHRDMQSQNVMIRSGEPFLIDFQGMRTGNPHYDLGSLLYDPYMDLTHDEREALLDAYCDLGVPCSRTDFRLFFLPAAAQRLMQALGAYGYLSLKKNLPEFRRHIPRGLANLLDAATRAGNLPSLVALTESCRERLGIRP